MTRTLQNIIGGGAGGSGSGEKNYISSSSVSTGWGESNDGILDISTTSTLSELPREFTTTTGIKIVGNTSANGEYVYYRFSLDGADAGHKLKIAWAQKEIAGYVSGELVVKMFYHDQPTYTGGAGYTEITVPNNDIADGEGSAIYTFDTDKVGIYYELRIEATVNNTSGVVISDVIVGPGKVIPGAVITEWTDFTPTGTLTGNTTYTGKYRRVGDTADIQMTAKFTGAPTPGATALVFDMPVGLTIDFSSITDSQENRRSPQFGESWFYDASGNKSWVGRSTFNTDGTKIEGFLFQDISATIYTENTQAFTATAPVLVASGDSFTVWLKGVPIAEWANSTVNFINDEVAAQNARFRASFNTTTTISSTALIPYDDLDFNEGGGSFAAGVYTVPTDGKYRVFGQYKFVGQTTAAITTTSIYINGSQVVRSQIPTNITTPTNKVEDVMDLIKGDTVEIRYAGDATSPNISNFAPDNYFTITRVPDFTAGQAVSFGQATEVDYGLTKRDRFEVRDHGIITVSGVVTTYSNLVVGRLYEIGFSGIADNFSASAANARVDWTFGGASYRYGKTQSGSYTESPDNQGAGMVVYVIADSTSFVMTATISGSNNIAGAQSYVIERNSYELTTF